MISAITSFNQEYYERIGQDCVRSWLANWSQDLELTCYVEGFSLPHQHRIKQIDFGQLGEEYRKFQSSDLKPRVKTFAKKAYCVIHAMENLRCDRIVWIDADTITKDMVTTRTILDLCPDDTCATFMGVYHHRDRQDIASELMFSAETGFFVLNTTHPGFDRFRKRYRAYYDQRLFHNLRRFYDGEVFGAVVKDLEKDISFRDLCGDLPKKYNSPMKHTAVGKFLVHHKSKHSKDDFASAKTG
jgi:hypothetical protein